MLTLIPGGASLDGMVAEIKRLLTEAEAQEDVLLFARSIVGDALYGQNDQLKTVLEYVRNNVAYQPDPDGTELFTSPHRMIILINQGIAVEDCDGHAIFCTALCRALGYRAHVILLDQLGEGYNHAACEVFSEETHLTYYMDSTIAGPLGTAELPANEQGSIVSHTPHYVKKLEVK